MRNKRKPFFSLVKSIVRIFNKKPTIINLNEEEIESGSIIISNHEIGRASCRERV